MARINAGSFLPKMNRQWLTGVLAFLLSTAIFLEALFALETTDTADGVQPLIEIQTQSLSEFIPPHIRPLLHSHEQEEFLKEVEGSAPDWTKLHQSNQTEQSERLFQFNRQRDKSRLTHKETLSQPIAFLWSGILRQYLPEYQGFSIAIGPETTMTSWGIIRFKPMGIPDYLVAIPDLKMRKLLRRRLAQKEQIEIQVLFMGTLVSDESIIYGFSHDNQEEGMILPVVFIQGVQYFIQSVAKDLRATSLRED